MKDTGYHGQGQSKAVKIGAAVVLVALVGIVLYASFSSFDFVGQATDPFTGQARDCVDGQFYQITDPEGNAKLFRCQGSPGEFGECSGTVCSKNKRITVSTNREKGAVSVIQPGTADEQVPVPGGATLRTFQVLVGTPLTLQVAEGVLLDNPTSTADDDFQSELLFRRWSDGNQQQRRVLPVTQHKELTAEWETLHEVTVLRTDSLPDSDARHINDPPGTSVALSLTGEAGFYGDARQLVLTPTPGPVPEPGAAFRFLKWKLESLDPQDITAPPTVSFPSCSLNPLSSCNPNTGVLTRTIDRPYRLTAVFDPRYTLTASTAGNGEGVVRVTGIDCGSPGIQNTGQSKDCSEVYNRDSDVTLAAVVSTGSGSAFTGWEVTGDTAATKVCPGTGTCTVKMSDHKQVKATFLKELVADVAIKLHVDPSQLSCGSVFIEKARWQHSSELCTFGGCGMLTISYLACLKKDPTGPFVGKIKTFATTGDDCDPVEVQQGSSTAANAGMLSPDPKTLLCRYYALSDGNQAARENYEDIQIGQACSEGYTSFGTFIADVSPPSGLTANHGTFHVCAKTHKETELPSFIIRRPDNFGSPQQISVPCYKDVQRNIVCDVNFYAPVVGAYTGTATTPQGWKVVKVDAVDGQNIVATHLCTQSLQTAACDFSLNGVPPDLNKMYIARVTATEIGGTVLCEVPITAPVFDASGVFTGFARTALTQPIGGTLGVREACAEFDVFGKRDPANAPSATAYEGIATTVNGIVADDGNAENGVETGVVQFGSLEHLRCTYQCKAIPQGVQVKSCKDLGALDVGPLTVNANEYFDIAPESSTCG